MTLARRCLAEALGTFVLVVAGCGAIMVAERTQAFGHAEVALAFGLVVAMVVAATGHLGGAHINPAVTIGLWSTGRVPAREVPPYVASQVVGAVAASAVLAWLLGPATSLGATTPSLDVTRAFVVEAGYTAILGLVIMGVAVDRRGPGPLAAVILGATVWAGALVTGPLTGGSFNPARSFGPALLSGTWTAHWLYWLAPTLGMVGAMQCYDRAFRPPR